MEYRKGVVFSRKSERNEMAGPESRFKPYREPLGLCTLIGQFGKKMEEDLNPEKICWRQHKEPGTT
jgi:hypothetical protein